MADVSSLSYLLSVLCVVLPLCKCTIHYFLIQSLCVNVCTQGASGQADEVLRRCGAAALRRARGEATIQTVPKDSCRL